MDEILAKLLTVPGAVGTMVVGRDGLVVTFAGQTEPDSDSLGAFTAEFVNQLESTLSSIGSLTNLTIEGEHGHFHLGAINEVTFLLLATRGGSNLGRARVELNAACRLLREEL
jgi:predicted regulator of Ras-like GTPase activity (Roadblock/LC7/MglB family)